MKIVGVTSCPTGIAHTYLAAEKLEQTAIELGYDVKFETQGAKAENVLTLSDVDSAEVIILAVDKNIDMSRFSGKKVKKVSTSKAIKEPKKVIEEAINDIGIRYIEDNTRKGSEQHQKNEKAGIYNHFMNGVNYMLPFVIAGGILIAISFAFGITASDPESLDYNVIAEAFSTIGDAAFSMMVPALAAGISVSISGDRSGFAPGIVAGLLANVGGAGFLGGLVGGIIAGYLTDIFSNKINVNRKISNMYHLVVVPLATILILGFIMIFLINIPISILLETLTNWLNNLSETSGVLFGVIIGVMMASDMGGPINKAISTFSIGLMSAGVNAPVAACMAAGMTPPLGIALATILYKNKFTEEERTAGQSNWLLGASYITEGAIPFAATDPLRVIPSLMLGSAITAAISMGANVTSLAPHGGIFVILVPNVINKPLIYFLAIVAGTVVTAIMLGFLKKPVESDVEVLT